MMSDLGLRLIKYSASAIAVLYGLYATLNEFHEVRQGKRMLTRKVPLLALVFFSWSGRSTSLLIC